MQIRNASETLSRFLRSEEGAVTVDMVPLISASVGLSLAMMGMIRGGVEDLSDTVVVSMLTGALGEEAARTWVEQQNGGLSASNAAGGTQVASAGDYVYQDETLYLPEGNYSIGGMIEVDTSIDLSDADPTAAPGNPGNDNSVGGAGETPSGDDVWGGGTQGRGDT